MKDNYLPKDEEENEEKQEEKGQPEINSGYKKKIIF